MVSDESWLLSQPLGEKSCVCVCVCLCVLFVSALLCLSIEFLLSVSVYVLNCLQ